MSLRRILFFADASSVHTRRWVAEMAQRGFDCVVVTRRPAALPGASEVISLRPGADAAGWFLALPAVRRLARQLQPRWLQGHYVTSYGLWGAAAAAVVPAPLVLTAWGSDILVTPRQRSLAGRFSAALVGHNLRRAALITADSQDMLAEIARYRVPARLEQVLWGADTDHFVPGYPAPGFSVLSLRAWEPDYRVDAIVRAFAALRQARPDTRAQLQLLGGGPEAAGLQALAKSLGLGLSVDFTGRVGDAEMVAAMQHARVSVSVPRSDGTSVSVLESMACGLPVLASDLPANREWLNPSCLLPNADDELVPALTAALLHLHDDPAAAAVQGQRNRALVVRQASRRAQMDRMAALYETLA